MVSRQVLDVAYEWARMQVGVDYIFDGKGPFFDCSGFYTSVLYVASRGRLDLRQSHNAEALRRLLEPITAPEPGAACFYGDVNHASHVMLWHPDGRVLGASGGGHTTTTVEAAWAAGACVRYRPSVRYRSPDDFIGFGRFPLRLLTDAINRGAKVV